MREVRRVDNEQGRFTLVFLAAPDDETQAANEKAPLLELTHNWSRRSTPEGGTSGIWRTPWKISTKPASG